MYRRGIILFFVIIVSVSCGTEEFAVNSSYFITLENNNSTLIYEGKKAGDFAETADKMNWKRVSKLIIKGHINNTDVSRISRYASPSFNGELKDLDFRDAELFEDQFINAPFNTGGKSIERFVYPRKMKATGDRVIENNYFIKEVIIPEEVEVLGERLFFWVSIKNAKGYPPLDIPYMPKEKYAVPTMVKTIGVDAFTYYPYEDLSLPESVERIANNAFMYTKLTQIVIPKKVTEISIYCFAFSADLKKIELHEGITSIAAGAFLATALERLDIPDSVTFIGESFINGIKTLSPDNIKWPKNMTFLGEQVMAGSEFEEFHIPQQFSNIGKSCFYGSDTKRLWFHKNISELGRGFINGMSKLEEVHIAWTMPPADNKLFDDVVINPLWSEINKSPDFDKVKLFVPVGTKQAYQSAPGWKNFKQIIEE